MPKELEIKVEIVDWWIKWWSDDAKHTVCMMVKIGDKVHLLERELEND